MELFTELFCALEQTTRTKDKVGALEEYFRAARPADAAWALQFLSGRAPARTISSRNLWDWAAVESGLPPWMMQECYDAVGDFGETLALVLPESGPGTALSLSEIVTQRLLPLKQLGELSRRQLLLATWRELNTPQRLVWNKLITGEFRVGVSRTLVIRALANVAGIEPAIMAHRVLGNWEASAEAFQQLLTHDQGTSETARPYPFFLASPLETKLKQDETLSDALGDLSQWQVEWKWDGIRAQLIRRNGDTCLWSRGDEMVNDSFPEIKQAGDFLPDRTVLDGEIVAWKSGRVALFAELQHRLGRKRVTPRLQNEFPVAFVAFDLLEWGGEDWREKPLRKRRERLEAVIEAAKAEFCEKGSAAKPSAATPFLFEHLESAAAEPEFPLQLSPLVKAGSWEELRAIRAQSRERGVEGLMLKLAGSRYGVGRQRGDWWKWKIEPFVIDAVLIYAQPGHGRRASLFTDYTFGVWDNGGLIPVAKAYSGLTDEEIRKVDSFIRRNTLEKHGSVRVVKPELVFELAFEGMQSSTRHKAGIALRFPRMNRWRHDKKAAEADTLEMLKALMKSAQDKQER